MKTERPIAVIGAMDIEVNAVLAAAEIEKVTDHGGMRFYSGTLSGVPVVVSRCSEGKVNSAICAQALIDLYSPRLVLNIGVAGGVGPDVHIGDAIIGSACVQYDFDSTPLGSPLACISVPAGDEQVSMVEFPCDGEASRVLRSCAESLYDGTVHSGVIATGDRFVADAEFGDWLHKTFGALCCEMEGGSIAHACAANKVPCAVLRTISDNARDEETVDFRTFAETSAAKAQALLKRVIAEL